MHPLLESKLKSKALIDAVIDQILKDINDGDTTAIWALLSNIPQEELIQFLPEEEWSKF